MSQIQEQMMFEEYIDGVLQLDDEQFYEYYDSLDEDQQEELEEVIGKIAKGIGKVAVAPITLPFKAVKGIAKGVGKVAKGAAKAVTSKPAKAAGSAIAKGAGMAAKGAASGIKKVANRLSTSGRADAAKKKADAIAKRTSERERLKKEKDRVDQERQKARDAMKKDIEKEKSESVDEAVAQKDAFVVTGGKGDNDQKVIGVFKDERSAKKARDDYNKNNRPAKPSHKARVYKQTRLSQAGKRYKPGEKISYSAYGNKMQFTKIKEAVDPQDTGGAEEVDMIMNQVKGMRHFLDGIESMISKDGDVEEWLQNKITKAHDYLKTAYSYKTGEEQKESAESYEPLEEFTSKQIDRLKKEYEPLRGKETGHSPETFAKLRNMMDRFQKPNLLALAKADIPILSSAAKAKLVMKFGMKWKSLPENFLPYIEIFADDNQELSEVKKGKFKEVDPKVIDRIEKMMRGSRAEKDSIANMLNYFMPPEVVDMVRYKLKIVPKRGKIKFR